jgi:hypothetical protein
MTTEEKRFALIDMCDEHLNCATCSLVGSCSLFNAQISEEEINEAYDKAFPSTPHIKDSGNRRLFETGAVRDIQEGKGRCDLLPLDVASEYLADVVLTDIYEFQRTGNVKCLYEALAEFDLWDPVTLLLEVSKHFEEGCKKYGENNWQKGIPVRCYIDSAVRHYLKWFRGDEDEPHNRAFCWNILCCIWTCVHKPELNDYRKGDINADEGENTMERNQGTAQSNDG